MFETLTLVDWIGILGSVIISGAYLAVSRGWVDARQPLFNVVNLVGAGLILTSLYERPNAGAIIIEVLWVLIAVFALAQYFFSKKKR